MASASSYEDACDPQFDPNWRKYVDLMRNLDLKGAYNLAKRWHKREPESPCLLYTSFSSSSRDKRRWTIAFASRLA